MSSAARNDYGGHGRLRRRIVEAAKSGPFTLLREIRKMAVYRIHDRLLDRLWQANENQAVRETIFLEQLSIDSENSNHGIEYTPSPHLVVRWIIASIGDRIPEMNFIDLGSGRGRVVSIAASLPFKSVTGVEFARELHEEAETMFGEGGDAVCKDVRFVHADATQITYPDGPCAFYLFNPFGHEVVKSLKQRIVEDHAANPREILILYSNPVHRRVFDSDARFERNRHSWVNHIKLNWLSPHEFESFSYRG